MHAVRLGAVGPTTAAPTYGVWLFAASTGGDLRIEEYDFTRPSGDGTALLGSELAMAVAADSTVKAIRVQFDVRVLFPDAEAYTVPLIQLMLATDDVRHLQKLLLTRLGIADKANGSERAIEEGELGHVVRLMSGHLCEAMEAFANLDHSCPGLSDAAAVDARAKDALLQVRRCWDAIVSGRRTKRRAFVDVMRNKVGFHYNAQMLKSTLDKHRRTRLSKSSLVLCFSGLGRFKVTDDLVKLLVVDEMGWNINEIRQRFAQEISNAIDVARSLGDLVDYVIAHLLAPHSSHIEQETEVLRIDPRIAIGKERVQKAKNAKKL